MNDITKPFNFILPTEIKYGEDSIAGLPGILKDRDIESVLLITDPVIKVQPFTADLLQNLSLAGINVTVFDRVEPNPKDYNVMEAAAAAVDMKARGIIALGGGSPIDCAKAAAVVAAFGGKVRDYEDSSKITGDALPLFTVPTTAGTGSEVTFSSVITDTSENFKFTVKSSMIAPKIAFIDPLLTHSMPPALTAAVGLDALTHAIEAFTARNANPLSDAAALHAVELINRSLVRAVRSPKDRTARDDMMNGSLLAGIAFSHSDVAAVHCIAEALGGKYDTPHGVCNAVTLPAIMEYNLDYGVSRYARIASAMGLPFGSEEEGARRAVERVKLLVKETGLPEFRSFGVQDEDLQELAENSARNGSNKDNPRPMTAEDYMTVLKRLMA
ncbi:MAG: iron-containing alcohol dehydrogenase [Spirochaetales bacterium]|nr:iron-containing alcohol dehydrogenase [Spirochaetales bacterium]